MALSGDQNDYTLIIGYSQYVYYEDRGGKGIDAHTSYLSFFLHEQNFWRIKFTPKKTRKLRQNTQKIVNFVRYYGKIHSKLPIFCVITAKYTVNCQFFALNL